MVPTRYWRDMTAQVQYLDDMMMAVQFIIHEDFIEIAKKLGVFDSWDRSKLVAECCDMDDGSGRVVLTVCGPVDNILQIEKDLLASDLPDDMMVWHEGPFGPQPCARA